MTSPRRRQAGWRSLLAVGALLALPAPHAAGQLLQVSDAQAISSTQGGLVGPIDDVDLLGRALAPLGDLDGDGRPEVAVSAPNDDDGGTNQGAVYVLTLNPDGTVAAEQKISATAGGFTGDLDDNDGFGESLAALGDLDGDGLPDLAVGARNDDDGGVGRGAVWVLFLNADGTVKAHQKISATEGGFAGTLDNLDNFGAAVASPGDLDGDGVIELAVGAPWDDDGGTARGAVWVLFLSDDGTVKAHQKISDTEGGFGGVLADGDDLGNALTALGDLDGDGVPDLAAGAYLDDDGGSGRGALWILMLTPDGSVHAEQKISDTEGGFDGVLADNDRFGGALATVGDPDCDGRELAVGARLDDSGGPALGAIWVLRLHADGTVADEQKLHANGGGLPFPLNNGDSIGSSLGSPGDLDGDGHPELLTGATGDDDGGPERGAVWVLFLERDELGSAYCFGDGGSCPCGNASAAGAGTGCANSSGAGGRLYATGSLSVAADDLVARVSGLLPNQPALLFVAEERINGGDGVSFGDGLRCAGVGLVRLGTAAPDAGGAACWGPGLGALAGWAPGDTRRMQAWYRDPQGPCSSGFDLTNGLELVLAP